MLSQKAHAWSKECTRRHTQSKEEGQEPGSRWDPLQPFKRNASGDERDESLIPSSHLLILPYPAHGATP